MSKVKVLYKPLGEVVILTLAPNMRRPDESEEQHLERYYKEVILKRPDLSKLPHENKNRTDFPKSDREKWRGKKGKGVHIDKDVVTRAEKKAAMTKEIDVELAKSEPDLKRVTRLQRKLDKREF